MERVIFDARNAVVGRMGTLVAKELLKGKEVYVIHSADAIISGKIKDIAERYGARMKMGQSASLKGPKYPRVADRFLKRVLRGMLPRDKAKGREAIDRLKCFIGNGGLTEEEMKKAIAPEKRNPMRFITIKQLLKEFN